MLDQNFVFVGAVFNLIGSFSYVIATLRGKTKPNRVTWFLWALAPLIAFSASLQEGLDLRSALMTFMVGFGPLMILLSSFINKKAYWKTTKFDLTCGAISLMAIALWLVTGDAILAIMFSIFADLLAAAPTVVKTYTNPESESYGVFLFGATSAAITLLTIDTWQPAYYAFPLYIFLICIAIFLLGKLSTYRARGVVEVEGVS